MTEQKTDPRVLRTRKLIMDSFIKLSEHIDFQDITIKEISAAAMINRATFYHHFKDKYDLLDSALTEVLQVNLSSDRYDNFHLNEETLTSIFLAVTNFQKSISVRCHHGYEDNIARIIREQLEVIFTKMLTKSPQFKEVEVLKITVAFISWGIYGASVDWRKNHKKLLPEDYIKFALPYIMSGIDFK